MEQFFEAFGQLAQTRSIWIYFIIFFGKLLEVTTSTLRIVLINRGIRVQGSLLAMLEITLWLMITSTVLANFQSDPLKVIVYAAAFGLGNYMGSWLDEKLAFGLSSIQIVVSDPCEANRLCDEMRKAGFGITSIDVHGMEEKPHYMMFTMIRRKLLQEALEIINSVTSNAVITVSDVKVQKGGYLRNSPTRHIPKRKAVAVPTAETVAPVQAEETTQTGNVAQVGEDK
ncbi:DUF5698 domain-containing protein [Christensenellaceae bacterium OttesenSCG-928-L17]|nr:DUF5698 domain-containing protein [Christensenellaceae bacterium OttesenSCG-928-L17]